MVIDASHKPAGAVRAAVPQFYRAETYQLQDSLGFMMRRVVASMVRAAEFELAPTGLTYAQWVPLFKLHLADGAPCTVAELAHHCVLDTGATTRLLDRLEAKGLCQRERSQEDRRVVKVVLTPEGAVAAQRIPGVLSQVQNACLAGFSHAEWDALKSMLRRVLDNAQALQSVQENHDDT